jgi:hypothetical protein
MSHNELSFVCVCLRASAVYISLFMLQPNSKGIKFA